MLVVVGLMTRCANQAVSRMHGHLDMLMGSHGAMECVDFLVLMLVRGVSHASRCRQDTHVVVAFPLFYCIEVMEAHWGFDELSDMHIHVSPTDWAQVGQ